MSSRLARQPVRATVGHDTDLVCSTERFPAVAQSGPGPDRRRACRDGDCCRSRASAGPTFEAGRSSGAGSAAAGPDCVPESGTAAGVAGVVAVRLTRLRLGCGGAGSIPPIWPGGVIEEADRRYHFKMMKAPTQSDLREVDSECDQRSSTVTPPQPFCKGLYRTTKDVF